jgi:ketosteroid isomerase-like protein
MNSTEWADGQPITPEHLPASITTYLAAHQARDLDTAMRYYAPDASVTDEGHRYSGRDEIRAWLASAASEFTYTIELTSAARFGADRYDAVHHLEGNFPGGVADLHFRFTLRDGQISELRIEP